MDKAFARRKTGSSENGNAIMAVLAASIVVTVAYFASMEATKTQIKQAVTDQQELEMTYYAKRVAGILSKPEECLNNFPAGSIVPSDGSTSGSEKKNFISFNGVPEIIAGQTIGNGSLSVPATAGFEILDTTKEKVPYTVPANATDQSVTLLVKADRRGDQARSFGSKNMVRRVTLVVSTDGGGAVTSCRAKTESDPVTCLPIIQENGAFEQTVVKANCPPDYHLMSGSISLTNVDDDASIESYAEVNTVTDPITKAVVSTNERWHCGSQHSNKNFNISCYAICCKY